MTREDFEKIKYEGCIQSLDSDSVADWAYDLWQKEIETKDALISELENALADIVDGNICHYHPVTGVCENGEHCDFCCSREALEKIKQHRKKDESK